MKIYTLEEGLMTLDINGNNIGILVSHGQVYVQAPEGTQSSNPSTLVLSPFFDLEPGCVFIGNHIDFDSDAVRGRRRYDFWRVKGGGEVIARYGYGEDEFISQASDPDSRIIEIAIGSLELK